MRKLAIVAALASTAIATPAVARDHSFYAGLEGGAMIVEDLNLDYRSGTTTIPTGTITSAMPSRDRFTTGTVRVMP